MMKRSLEYAVKPVARQIGPFDDIDVAGYVGYALGKNGHGFYDITHFSSFIST